MYSKAKIGGHPIHPMLVAFPITFYTLSLIAFAVYQYFNTDLFWYRLGYFSTFAGVATAILAATPGFIDWAMGIPKNTAARKRGIIHMTFNVVALVLFIFNAGQIYGSWDTAQSVNSVIIVALLGVLLTLAAGYHGWELVATHKVGVSLTPEQQRLEPTEKMSRRDHEVDSHPRGTTPQTV